MGATRTGCLSILVLSCLGCGASGDGAAADPAARDGAPGPTSAAASLVLRGVTVLSPIDGARHSGQTVSIAGERIVGVEPEDAARVPAGATVVDGAGLFLIPGLWDFHTHFSDADPNAPPLMVTQGVTGARDLGGDLYVLDALRDRIRSGEVLGPRIARAGPTLNGAPNAPHHRVIDTPESAREAVADLMSKGVDLLKTHNATEREPYFALLEAASAAGLDVVGHVPVGISPLEACEAGQASIDHIATIFEGVYLARFSSDMEAFQSMSAWIENEAPSLVDCCSRHGTLFVPTLFTYYFRAHRAAFYDEPPEGWRYLTAANQAAFREQLTPSEMDRNPQVIALRASLVDVGKTLTRLLHEAGAPIGAGTDFGVGGLVPGFALHREIELLVEAGLPEHAAIWASARGPGERAGADPLTGRIETGAPADLVLLRADPFAAIEGLGSIEAVIVGGRLVDRAELDWVLAELAAS